MCAVQSVTGHFPANFGICQVNFSLCLTQVSIISYAIFLFNNMCVLTFSVVYYEHYVRTKQEPPPSITDKYRYILCRELCSVCLSEIMQTTYVYICTYIRSGYIICTYVQTNVHKNNAHTYVCIYASLQEKEKQAYLHMYVWYICYLHTDKTLIAMYIRRHLLKKRYRNTHQQTFHTQVDLKIWGQGKESHLYVPKYVHISHTVTQLYTQTSPQDMELLTNISYTGKPQDMETRKGITPPCT